MAADTPFLRPDTHTPRPAEGHEPIGPGRRENPLISADVVKSSGLLGTRGNGCLAEREGFEPSIRFWRILTFQASAFDHSATAPHVLEGMPPIVPGTFSQASLSFPARIRKFLRMERSGTDRKSVVSGKSVSVRVDIGGCRVIK